MSDGEQYRTTWPSCCTTFAGLNFFVSLRVFHASSKGDEEEQKHTADRVHKTWRICYTSLQNFTPSWLFYTTTSQGPFPLSCHCMPGPTPHGSWHSDSFTTVLFSFYNSLPREGSTLLIRRDCTNVPLLLLFSVLLLHQVFWCTS